MTSINSHIQITQAILKGFAHRSEDGYKVFYLDLSDNNIKEEKINKLGTELNYYDADVEKFLNDEVENKIGELIKQMKDFEKGKYVKFIFTPEIHVIIRRFFKYSFIRSTKIVKIANKKSELASVLGLCTTNNIIKFVDDSILDPFYNSYDSDIIINSSKVEFVAPRNCFYSIHTEGKFAKYVLPISPKIGFILIRKSELNCVYINGQHHYMNITDDEIARGFNKNALLSELEFNNDFIVANNKTELIELKKFIDETKNKMMSPHL